MKRPPIAILSLIAALNFGAGDRSTTTQSSLADVVNPLIGTAPSRTISALRHGEGTENNAQVIPEVTVPFGMTNWTPQTRVTEAKCVAPYYYSDTLISGFRGTHWLSGSCTQDYGSFTLMPVTGSVNCLTEKRASRYFHDNEISSPYYYSVFLEKYNIRTEITATTRCGLLRFTFGRSDRGTIFIEPNSDFGEGSLVIIPEKKEIVGFNPVHRIYQGWGKRAGFCGYFVAQFSRGFASYGVYHDSTRQTGNREISNLKKSGGFVSFALAPSENITVKIGTSFTSAEEARKNLERETNGLDFDAAKERLKTRWDAMLSKVQVRGGSMKSRTNFYTALYHAFILPRTYNDVDGSYPSFAGGDSICNSGDHTYYCDFSLWDTYRALHPLFNLVIPEINADMVRSLLLKAEEGGWLPIYPCWNSYTAEMIGDHAISVVADAYVKNVVTLTEKDYSYLKKNATETPNEYREYLDGKGVRALRSYIKYGFIPLEDSVNESFHRGEQVSRTLEYAYDDFALSQISKKMGKEDDYTYFLERSRNYRNVYDARVACVSGRSIDGTFTKDFSRTARMPYITEGTPGQYLWYVPQDVIGLMRLMGGKEKFNESLDQFFASGQYWHGNEPDQQVPFLYVYSGEPWKTRNVVRQILNEEYDNTPGGLSGNDDAGQISAWYIFASLGMYPVCPSSQEYVLTAPAFEESVVDLPEGKKLIIRAKGASEGTNHVSAIHFGQTSVENFQLSHSDLVHGGVLEFTMARDPGAEN
ncbi:MAG TPA: GH92 family glycosyl hydrolase [Bacteroidota bacterium]|nr:GH92 family glycosyl hydrolase [Bacteroidota bacterium]